jgi:predicted nucleic acid-binding protein
MIRAVLADSGPLYAVADEGDGHHQRALRQWQELDRLGLSVLVSYPVLLEAHRLVLQRLGTTAALEWLVEALDAPLMNPTPEDYTQALAIMRSLPDQPVSLVNATVAPLSRRLKLEVWTYDHHFDVMRVPVWRG